MSNVIPIGGITTLDIPVDQVLEQAKGKMKTVVLIGWDTDGDIYFASTISHGPEVLWILEQCKLALLDTQMDEEEDD